ncbi:MAG: hypothetical protein A2Y18_03170 [Clostridiales bacterium GWD2_32_19]|nr:MAG: hypothetical protein A2Y18_03170 [Clostridiales bacterium GWD2_32_19]
MKKKWFNIIILVGSLLVFFGIVAFTDGADKFIQNIAKVSFELFLLAIVAMITYWMLEAIILYIFVKSKYKEYSFMAVLRVSMIGQFFNSVTPFSTGGQPMQLYAMTKDGISSGEAGSILVMKFIVYQVILTLYSIMVIFFKYNFFVSHVDKFMLLALIGFIVNSFVMVVLFAFTHYAELTTKYIHSLVKLCSKFKICRHSDDIENKIKDELTYFKEHSKSLKSNMKVLVTTSLLTIMQLTIFFSISYIIYRGFGKTGNMTDIISANAFVTMITSFVPLPGASGGAEVSFGMLFNIFLEPGKILPAIFLWRFVTFYLNIIVGGMVALLAPEQPLKA